MSRAASGAFSWRRRSLTNSQESDITTPTPLQSPFVVRNTFIDVAREDELPRRSGSVPPSPSSHASSSLDFLPPDELGLPAAFVGTQESDMTTPTPLQSPFIARNTFIELPRRSFSVPSPSSHASLSLDILPPDELGLPADFAGTQECLGTKGAEFPVVADTLPAALQSPFVVRNTFIDVAREEVLPRRSGSAPPSGSRFGTPTLEAATPERVRPQWSPAEAALVADPTPQRLRFVFHDAMYGPTYLEPEQPVWSGDHQQPYPFQETKPIPAGPMNDIRPWRTGASLVDTPGNAANKALQFGGRKRDAQRDEPAQLTALDPAASFRSVDFRLFQSSMVAGATPTTVAPLAPALARQPKAMWCGRAAAGAPLASPGPGSSSGATSVASGATSAGEEADSPNVAGHAGHFAGMCKPCAFFSSGLCLKGEDCSYCHLPHAHSIAKRFRPPKRIRQRIGQAMAARGL